MIKLISVNDEYKYGTFTGQAEWLGAGWYVLVNDLFLDLRGAWNTFLLNLASP